MSANQVKTSGAIPSLWPGLSGEDAEGPYLEGAMCASCGTVILGLRSICPQCWAQCSMQQLKLGRTGTVYTRTVIHQAPEGFEAPYTAGMVDLGEGIRVFAHLEAGAARPEIGDTVELEIVPLRKAKDGSPLSGPRYRKLN